MYIKLTQNEVMKLNEKGIFFLAIIREDSDQIVYTKDNLQDIEYQNITQSYQKELNTQAKLYLKDTDWYITRYAETKQDIPQTILDNRQLCRELIEV